MTESPSPGKYFPLLRWYGASAFFGLPQAAAPITFSLATLKMTGRAEDGAAMILAMTVAQIIGVIPITRGAKRYPSGAIVRALIVWRAFALLALAICIQLKWPFAVLIIFSALAGLANGAAYGHLRALLNALVSPNSMPRALGVAATINELVYVLTPIAATMMASVSPAFTVLMIAVASVVPAILISSSAPAPVPTREKRAPLYRALLFAWLTCAICGGATVAVIEVGAVSLALRYGYEPTSAILFTLPLCVAAILGGTWFAWRNQLGSHDGVLIQLSLMSLGSALVAWADAPLIAIMGAAIVGMVLAPLGAHLTLILEAIAPVERRPEAFALLRTANALGIIFGSASLAILGVTLAFKVISFFLVLATMLAYLLPRPSITSQRHVTL